MSEISCGVDQGRRPQSYCLALSCRWRHRYRRRRPSGLSSSPAIVLLVNCQRATVEDAAAVVACRAGVNGAADERQGAADVVVEAAAAKRSPSSRRGCRYERDRRVYAVVNATAVRAGCRVVGKGGVGDG